MPAIQTCVLVIQMTEHINKLSKMVSKGRPKIHKKSQKSILEPSRVPLSASVTHSIAKWSKNCGQGPPNGTKMVIRGA